MTSCRRLVQRQQSQASLATERGETCFTVRWARDHVHACGCGAGLLCPRMMALGINNSVATSASHMARVSVFAPFWIDNRTGFDLLFRDLDVHPWFDPLTPLLRECASRSRLFVDASA